jgi:alkyl hydroperoxide reductase subunit AhpF
LFGVPAGYECSTLLEDVIDAGGGAAAPAESVRALEVVDQGVHIQVFVTPTCPNCPPAVLAAHQLARVNEHITADMVMANEFPDAAQRFSVMTVPKTVINDTHTLEGAAPQEDVVRAVLQAVGAPVPELP